MRLHTQCIASESIEPVVRPSAGFDWNTLARPQSLTILPPVAVSIIGVLAALASGKSATEAAHGNGFAMPVLSVALRMLLQRL